MTPKKAAGYIILLLTMCADSSGDTSEGILSLTFIRALGVALEALAHLDPAAAAVVAKATPKLDALTFNEMHVKFGRHPWEK